MDTTPKTDQLIVNTVGKAFPDVLAIYRYGSAGSEYQRPGSDIDIAVLTDGRLPVKTISELSASLASALGKDVDLHDIRSLPVTLRVQIVLDGRRLYGKHAPAEAYETQVLSEYVRLNEERREILNDIKKRGHIYGKTSAG